MIPTFSGDAPYLTTEQMIEVDRAMMEDFRIDLIQMMENAGRSLAILARQRFLDFAPKGRRVTVLAGTGGNGGGALVAARRLHNWGADVRVFVTKSIDGFTPVPAHQFDILRRMNVPVDEAAQVESSAAPDIVLDGVIGYSLKGAPRSEAARLIRWANTHPAPVLALDAPSGVDTTTGKAFDPAVQATATMTLALPKDGLRAPGVESHVGELYLADISVPPALYANEKLGLRVEPIFAAGDIVRLR